MLVTCKYACEKCCALMFKDEPHKKIDKSTDELCYSLCCSYGAVQVPPVSEPPPLLKTLLSGNSSTSCHFMKNIRAYNSAFAFASMTLTGHEYAFQGKGPYCFRINGQVYHTISQLFPEPGSPHKFSQIYLYDAAEEVNARFHIFGDLLKRYCKGVTGNGKLCKPICSFVPWCVRLATLQPNTRCGFGPQDIW